MQQYTRKTYRRIYCKHTILFFQCTRVVKCLFSRQCNTAENVFDTGSIYIPIYLTMLWPIFTYHIYILGYQYYNMYFKVCSSNY